MGRKSHSVCSYNKGNIARLGHNKSVRTSTPISFVGDGTRLNETPCSVQAPDNISLISEDLSVSLEADNQLLRKLTHKTISLSHMVKHLEL